MTGRCLFKSLLSLMPLLVVGYALRADIQSFVLAPLQSINLPKVEPLKATAEFPQDHKEAWLAVLDGTELIPQTKGNEPPEFAAVWNTSNRGSETRKNAQRLLKELERVSPDDAEAAKLDDVNLPANFPFLNVWSEQKRLVEAERKLRAARRQNPDNVKELRTQLADVRKRLKDAKQDQLAMHAEFLRLEEAELHGHELRQLKPLRTEALLQPLAERGFQVLADRAFDEACQKLAARIDGLKGYTTAYGLLGSHAEWIKTETAHCDQVRRFLEAVRDLDESRIGDRMRWLAKLHEATDVPESVRALALLGTRRICDMYLARTVPLDDLVLLMDGPEPESQSLSVSRKEVALVWEDKRLEWFVDSGHDEFTLPSERLRRVIVTGKGARPAILKGTPKSEAASTYNRLRQDTTWTGESLKRLKQGCQPHSTLLGEAWPKVVELEKLATELPVLFVGSQSE